MAKKVNYTGGSKVTKRLCDINNESQVDEQVASLVTAATKLTDVVAALGSATEYSELLTYQTGDRCRKELVIYECVTAITEPETWTESHWNSVSDEQEQIDAILDILKKI